MMIDAEMTDAEVAAQVVRTDRFIAEFRELIAGTTVDPRSSCAGARQRGLQRIAATVDQVDYIVFANLANINAAMRGGLLEVLEVRLLAVGAGPTLDFTDAAAFLAVFQPMIDMARARRLQ